MSAPAAEISHFAKTKKANEKCEKRDGGWGRELRLTANPFIVLYSTSWGRSRSVDGFYSRGTGSSNIRA